MCRISWAIHTDIMIEAFLRNFLKTFLKFLVAMKYNLDKWDVYVDVYSLSNFPALAEKNIKFRYACGVAEINRMHITNKEHLVQEFFFTLGDFLFDLVEFDI